MHSFYSNKKITARCPGRLSFSKHADYINSQLLYTLDDRATYITSCIQEKQEPDARILLSNKHFTDKVIKVSELDQALNNNQEWYFYIFKIIKELNIDKKLNNHDLYIEVSSTIPIAAGLSSSHALILASICSLTNQFNIKKLQQVFQNPLADKQASLELLRFCQQIEHARGFKSGLGDQAALLFSKENYITAIKIFPDLQIDFIKLPENIAIISVPSFVKADKSSPDIKEKNIILEKYKTLNDFAKNYNVSYLADLHETYQEKEIFKIIKSIDDIQKKGLALYGLAESKRLKLLSEEFSVERLGHHLNISHKAEANFVFSKNNDVKKLSEEEKLNFQLNPKLPLEEHPGYYHASTLENDTLQNLALNFNGVYGSTITGAGFGGNNIVVIDLDRAQEFREYLIGNYYMLQYPDKDLSSLHICKSSIGVSLTQTT